MWWLVAVYKIEHGSRTGTDTKWWIYDSTSRWVYCLACIKRSHNTHGHQQGAFINYPLHFNFLLTISIVVYQSFKGIMCYSFTCILFKCGFSFFLQVIPSWWRSSYLHILLKFWPTMLHLRYKLFWINTVTYLKQNAATNITCWTGHMWTMVAMGTGALHAWGGCIKWLVHTSFCKFWFRLWR